jgi:Holliday junction resolvase
VSKSKDKGRRAEHDIVNRHLALGVTAERVPLSGSLGGKYSDDVDLPYGKGEVKARKNGEGFKTIETWMKTCAALFLKRDRVAPLVVLTWDAYADLVRRAYATQQQTEGATDGAA